MKRTICFIMILAMIFLCGCGSDDNTEPSMDESTFEAALNNGENTIGKTVTFTVNDVKLYTANEYPNLWAGEHLNFIYKEDPGKKVGDVVTVKVLTVKKTGKESWIINAPEDLYKLENTDHGIFTKTISLKNVSVGVPENAKKSPLSDSQTVSYYNDEVEIMISFGEKGVDLTNSYEIKLITGTDSFERIPIGTYPAIKYESDNKYSFAVRVFFNCSGKLCTVSCFSTESLEKARELFKTFETTISIED